jgi:hypothetical protein
MKAKYKHYGNERIIYDQAICEDNIFVTVRSYYCNWSITEPDVRTKVCPTNSEARRMFFNFCKKCEKERYECEYKEDGL